MWFHDSWWISLSFTINLKKWIMNDKYYELHLSLEIDYILISPNSSKTKNMSFVTFEIISHTNLLFANSYDQWKKSQEISF